MANDLYEKLGRLQWALHRRQAHGWARNGPMADRSRGQGRILATLKRQDGISTKDLAHMLGVQISSLNEVLSKMEKAGYVTREPSEKDRRVMLVKLTQKGIDEQQSEVEGFNDIFTCLSEEEQKAFAEYLDRITEAIKASAKDKGRDPESYFGHHPHHHWAKHP